MDVPGYRDGREQGWGRRAVLAAGTAGLSGEREIVVPVRGLLPENAFRRRRDDNLHRWAVTESLGASLWQPARQPVLSGPGRGATMGLAKLRGPGPYPLLSNACTNSFEPELSQARAFPFAADRRRSLRPARAGWERQYEDVRFRLSPALLGLARTALRGQFMKEVTEITSSGSGVPASIPVGGGFGLAMDREGREEEWRLSPGTRFPGRAKSGGMEILDGGVKGEGEREEPVLGVTKAVG
ncbi:hypothetical protein EI94DRAFT_1790422 [Lactarius quietus]|nr:hypothetical protein EI94DRAFT_1790422 [Lactarius quietus]